MRRFLRRLARANMERAGVKKINKKHADGSSFFSENWRKWL